jgi:PhnB protein
MRYPMPDGRIGHAELVYRDNVVMLASEFEGFGTSPLRLPAVHCMIYCYVEDADKHCERALDAGATIVSEPRDEHGTRMYRALDPEGHRWMFAMPLARGGS